MSHGSIAVSHAHTHGITGGAGDAVSAAIFVTLVHTMAMLAVAGVIAVFVYEVVGLTILRRAWFNLDRLCQLAGEMLAMTSN